MTGAVGKSRNSKPAAKISSRVDCGAVTNVLAAAPQAARTVDKGKPRANLMDNVPTVSLLAVVEESD
jgi:hypothetical protein